MVLYLSQIYRISVKNLGFRRKSIIFAATNIQSMANKKETEGQKQPAEMPSQPRTKKVRNRGNGKIELLIEGKIVVFPPKGTVNVPIDFEVPNGIGLYVME